MLDAYGTLGSVCELQGGSEGVPSMVVVVLVVVGDGGGDGSGGGSGGGGGDGGRW